MDPFKRLPPEVRLYILLSFDDITDAVVASHHSTALFRQCRASCGRLMAHYGLHIEREPDIMQDALAILHFPTQYLHCPSHHAIETWSHLQKWAANELPNPLWPADFATLVALDALYSHMWRYIQDYLSKAIGEYLPIAYRHTPQWAHLSISYTPSQRMLGDLAPFPLRQLSPLQRHDILQSFLHYELLCKTYGPTYGADLEAWKHRFFHQDSGATACGRMAANRNAEDDGVGGIVCECADPVQLSQQEKTTAQFYRKWDWYLLLSLKPRGVLCACKVQAMTAVREYVLSVYGAILADQMMAGIPAPNSDYRRHNIRGDFVRRPYLSPASLDLRPSPVDVIWDGLFTAHGISGGILSFIASAGFNLLTSTLLHNVQYFCTLLNQLHDEVHVNWPPVKRFFVENFQGAGERQPPASFFTGSFEEGKIMMLHVARQRAWSILPVSGGESYAAPVFGLSTDVGIWEHNIEGVAHGPGERPYVSFPRTIEAFWKGPMVAVD